MEKWIFGMIQRCIYKEFKGVCVENLKLLVNVKIVKVCLIRDKFYVFEGLLEIIGMLFVIE